MGHKRLHLFFPYESLVHLLSSLISFGGLPKQGLVNCTYKSEIIFRKK